MIASFLLLASLVLEGLAFGTPVECPSLEEGAGPLDEPPGQRHLALVVGVADYRAKLDGQSIDLQGPAHDARQLRDLLDSEFGFPRRSLCLLTDDAATLDQLQRAWKEHLEQATAGDTVVFYFAGHGSQIPDLDGPKDESDGLDETFLLHDSRTPGVPDLVDDDLNRMLASLYGRTTNVTVILDTSHGVGSTRGRAHPLEEGMLERYVPRADGATHGETGRPEFVPQRFPQMVTLTAAQDGHPALERDGRGVFTTALLQSLQQRPEATWHQVAHDVSRWVAALHSWQRPRFEGNLDRWVFGTADGRRTSPWTVTAVNGPWIMLEGPWLPGWGQGAVVGIFGPREEEPKARIQVERITPSSARGRVLGRARHKVHPGDRARLEVPGDTLTSIRVRFDTASSVEQAVAAALAADVVLERTVKVVRASADYVLRPGPNDTVDIVGADGVRRNRLAMKGDADAKSLAYVLGLYARQASLLALSGEVPEQYPRDVFELRIVPMQGHPGCERTSYEPARRALPWAQVPMCNAVQLQVSLVEEPKQPLHLGILYLAGNGAIHAWPQGGTQEILAARGDRYVQQLGWVTPPLNTPDRILVFGTHEPVDWSALAAQTLPDAVATRGTGAQGFVFSAVSGAGTRGQWATEGEGSSPGWTASLMSLEVVADPRRWSERERDTTATCANLRASACIGD